MDGDAFAREMAERVAGFCRQYDGAFPAYSYIPLESDEQRLRVMQSRLFNEVRAAEVFGSWLRTTPELEVKETLAEPAPEEMWQAKLLGGAGGGRRTRTCT